MTFSLTPPSDHGVIVVRGRLDDVIPPPATPIAAPWVNPTGLREECFMAHGHGVAYAYGRRRYPATPPSDLVRAVGRVVNLTLRELGLPSVDCCFLNRYQNGAGLGWHADDEPTMCHKHPIVTVSHGREASFMVRRNARGAKRVRFRATHGSMIIMPPGYQQTHRHAVDRSDDTRVRTSLTFRKWVRR